MKKILFNILSVSFLLTSLFGCVEYPDISPGVKGAGVPVFERGDAIPPDERTASSVTVSAKITMENGSKITERGFYYGTNPLPTSEDGVALDEGGVGIGSYSVKIENLINDTTYYFIPYAINSEGTGFGEVISGKTNPGLGEIMTVKPFDVLAATFRAGAEIISLGEGGEDKITVGIYLYSAMSSVAIDTITDALYLDGNKYYYQVVGLSPSTKYYVKAFIENDYGIFIGLADTITTKDGMFAVEETVVVPGYTDATFLSSVDNGGDSTVTIEERGFYWSKTTLLPTSGDSVLRCGKGVGNFSGRVDDLEAKESYYVRAYAKNNFGMTVYGKERPFNTKTDVPSVETENIDLTKIQNGNAEIRGIVTDEGKSAIIYSGICWSTTNDKPTELTDSYRHNTSVGVGEVFSELLTGLRGGVRYYVRAYAKNDNGTSYGEVKEFRTPPIFDTSLKPLSGAAARLQNSTAYFVIDGNLCLLGGDLGATPTNEFLMYNISSDNWSSRLSFESPTKWQSGVGYGSGAYVYGGLDGNGDEKAGLFYYNFSDNKWRREEGPDSVAVCRALGYANSNGVFYIGGMSGDTVKNDTWCFIAQSYWERRTDFPVKQYGGIAVVIDNIAYVGMGKDSTDVCNGKIWTTEDGAMTWNLKTECTIFNGSILAGVACNKRLYVIDEGYNILEYDPATDVWKIKSQLPSSHRRVHCIYSVNNKIYIGLGDTNSLITYDPLWDN